MAAGVVQVQRQRRRRSGRVGGGVGGGGRGSRVVKTLQSAGVKEVSVNVGVPKAPLGSRPLRLALPSKGRMSEDTMQLLQDMQHWHPVR